MKLTDAITKDNACEIAKDILFSLDPRLRAQDLYMFCTQEFADAYNESYLLTHGGINYNNQYAQQTVEGSNGRLHIIPMYNKIGSKFIHITPKINMLVGYDQMGDIESVLVKEYEPFILSYIATMFFGVQFESIDNYMLKKKDRQLNQLRSVATYYKEYSSIENLQLLGENYIRQMKRDLTPLTFQTSILCQRIGIAKDGFYSSMREKHKYDASNFEFLDEIAEQYYAGFAPEYLDSRADKDINPLAPICIGMDYNANINWIVAGQPSGRRLNVLKSFYVRFERKLPALISDFCTYYEHHKNKTVVFYYDTTALGSNYAVNEQDFRWVIIHEFERHGWTVVDVYLGNPMRHDEKYLLINQGFAGKQRLMPFFNRQNNDDLILAIQAAGVTRGRNGFRKDKGGEKLAESEEDLLEHRTDGTDAFDNLYIGCEKFPQENITPNTYSVSGVI